MKTTQPAAENPVNRRQPVDAIPASSTTMNGRLKKDGVLNGSSGKSIICFLQYAWQHWLLHRPKTAVCQFSKYPAISAKAI